MAGGLLLAALAGGGFLLWKRRQAKLALAALDNRLPHEVALDELERIGRLGLPEQGRFKEHYALVSDTVRLYIERTYHVPMLERTTGEIRMGILQTSISRADAAQLFAFLDDSDLVKFSEYQPSESSAYELITRGRSIVEATKPLVISDEDIDDNEEPKKENFSANGHMKKIEVTA